MTDNARKARALIVDDEADIRELIEITLARMGLDSVAVATLAAARAALQDTPFDLCLTDMRLPDGSGLDLIGWLGSRQPDCPIAVITAYGNAESAVASLKAGAFDYVTKPLDITVLRQLVAQTLKLPRTARTQPIRSKAGRGHPSRPPQLIGQTPTMQVLRKTIAKLARSQAPVYIAGESGTGKELVARSIHAGGPRAGAAFVPVNCGAIPAELMESEFFGYRKGAFTGADRDRPGLVQQADGGTLFLDEIADMPLAMQVKLLRLIQERAVRRLGDTQEYPVDLRIICATHRNLATEVNRGHFREDLFYRLNVIEIHVPPLRERAADIAPLAEQIVQRLADRLHLQPPPTLSPIAMRNLRAYAFPGNIRELENILERAITLSDAAVIEAEFLRLESPLGAGPVDTANAAQTLHIPVDADLESQLEALERQRIRDTLIANRYNKTQSAKALGISFRALRYRMEKLGLDRE